MQRYDLTIQSPAGVSLEVIRESDVRLDPGATMLVPLALTFDRRITREDGNAVTRLLIVDEDDNRRIVEFRVLGPR